MFARSPPISKSPSTENFFFRSDSSPFLVNLVSIFFQKVKVAQFWLSLVEPQRHCSLAQRQTTWLSKRGLDSSSSHWLTVRLLSLFCLLEKMICLIRYQIHLDPKFDNFKLHFNESCHSLHLYSTVVGFLRTTMECFPTEPVSSL